MQINSVKTNAEIFLHDINKTKMIYLWYFLSVFSILLIIQVGMISENYRLNENATQDIRNTFAADKSRFEGQVSFCVVDKRNRIIKHVTQNRRSYKS